MTFPFPRSRPCLPSSYHPLIPLPPLPLFPSTVFHFLCSFLSFLLCYLPCLGTISLPLSPSFPPLPHLIIPSSRRNRVIKYRAGVGAVLKRQRKLRTRATMMKGGIRRRSVGGGGCNFFGSVVITSKHLAAFTTKTRARCREYHARVSRSFFRSLD